MFEFYFQRGDFAGDSSGVVDFIKDLVVQIVGTGIGAWAAFSVYRAQRQDAIEKENKVKNDFEVDKLRYLAQLFIGSISFAKSLHGSLVNILEQLRLDVYKYPELILGTPTDLKRIVDKIDREAFYHAYRNQMNDHFIQSLFANADLLKEQFDVFMQAYMSEQPESIRLRKEIKRLSAAIDDRLTAFCSVSDEYNDYRITINTWFQDVLEEMRQQRMTFDFMLEHFLLPLLNNAPVELKRNDSEFRSLLIEADECYSNIVQLGNAHRGLESRTFVLIQSVASLEQSMSERIKPLQKFLQGS